MKRISELIQIFLLLILITSCKTSLYKNETKINSEGNINEQATVEKKRMEIKFSCGENGISE